MKYTVKVKEINYGTIALVIYVEASSPDAAGTAIATLGGYTQQFIADCYKP